MGYQLPNGSSVQLGGTVSTGIVITGATNTAAVANDYTKGCTLTFTGTAPAGLGVGSVVMLSKSPWIKALNTCHIVGKFDGTAKTITLASFDTSDTTKYPAGAFTAAAPGEVVMISGFVDFPYITNVAVSGGDQQTTSFQPLQVAQSISLNTTKNPLIQTYTLTHDSEDPIRPMLEKLDESQQVCAIKFINPAAASGKGETRLYAAKVAFQKIPSAEVNNVETVSAALSMQSDMRIYRTDLVKALAP